MRLSVSKIMVGCSPPHVLMEQLFHVVSMRKNVGGEPRWSTTMAANLRGGAEEQRSVATSAGDGDVCQLVMFVGKKKLHLLFVGPVLMSITPLMFVG